MIRMLGAMVGAVDRASRLAEELAAGLAETRDRAAQLPRRPRVYFEEWDEPMISGIAWVSELIEAAGGIDVFADRAAGESAQDRIVTAPEGRRRDAGYHHRFVVRQEVPGRRRLPHGPTSIRRQPSKTMPFTRSSRR